MDLILSRVQYRADGIFGELTDLNTVLLAVTLEHAYALDGEGGFYPKIPLGTYQCNRGIHQLEHMSHPFETFEVQNVPGHKNILIHWGNFNSDSSGCILVGESFKPSERGQMITNSKSTFEKFMAVESGYKSFSLTIRG